MLKIIVCFYLESLQTKNMFNGQKIKHLLEERKQTKKSLLSIINITGAALDNITNGISMPKADNLEKIADFFELPIDYFFDREDYSNSHIGHHVNGNGNKVSGDITLSECQKENQHLRELLAEKERTIQILLNQNK